MHIKQDSLKTIKDISKLEFDWNGYGANPINKKAIKLSKDIIMILDVQPDIFPTARQSIQMEYRTENGSYLEFEIFEDKITTLEVPHRNYNKNIQQKIDPGNYIILSDILNEFFSKND